MEGASDLLARVEVELFGEKRVMEPSFETILAFEEISGSSILNPANWHPMPKLTVVAALLWAAIGGRKSGKSVAELYAQVNAQTTAAAVALAVLVNQQYQGAEKKGDAA